MDRLYDRGELLSSPLNIVQFKPTIPKDHSLAIRAAKVILGQGGNEYAVLQALLNEPARVDTSAEIDTHM